MLTRLIILGLLLEQGPMHGYQIKSRTEHEAMSEWAGISYRAIYFALKKLAEEGFVEKIGTEQVGKRPSRDVYQIIEEGQEEFLRLLRQTLGAVEYEATPVDIGVRFMSALPRQEGQALLEKRWDTLEHERQALTEEWAGFVQGHEGAPYFEGARVLFDHWLVRLEAELSWLRGVIEKLEQGLLP
jgi:DNA-binding PadR family transcriptional regulator